MQAPYSDFLPTASARRPGLLHALGALAERPGARTLRYVLGVLCIAAGVLFPYYEGGSVYALRQLFMLGTFSAAALLFGLRAVPPALWGLVLGAMALMLIGPNPYPSRPVIGVAGLVLLLLASLMGANLRENPRIVPWVLYALLAGAFFNALAGLVQWIGLSEYYAWCNCLVQPEQPNGNAVGAFKQRNLFASFLMVGVVCTLWLVHLRQLKEPLGWTVLLVLLMAVAASSSRTGLAGSLVIAALGIYWRKHHCPAVTRLMTGQLALLGLCVVGLTVLADWLGIDHLGAAGRLASASNGERVLIWLNTLEMIAQRPWLGWGWSETGYAHYVTLFERRNNGGMLDHSHNLVLQIALEFGIPAALAVCAAAALTLARLKPWRLDGHANGLARTRQGQQFAWTLLLLIVGIHSMLEYPLWFAPFLLVTGLCLGLGLPASSRLAGAAWYAPLSRRLGAAAALGLITLAAAGWRQYGQVLPVYSTDPYVTDAQFVQNAQAAIKAASGEWMFREKLDFAQLSLVQVNEENAQTVREMAEKQLHYSAEATVIKPLLLSLALLHDTEALRFHTQHYCRAFPADFKQWRQTFATHPMMYEAGRVADDCTISVITAKVSSLKMPNE